MPKAVLVAPWGTVTLAGTVAAALLLESKTVAPPTGAGLLTVTVPVVGAPPIRLEGDTVRDESAAGRKTTSRK